jgi:hypothetical protein
MYKFIILIIQLIVAGAFIFHQPLQKVNIKQYLHSCSCNERTIYKNYLIGLRKTRRYINNTTNINTLSSIVNFTNNFTQNVNISVPINNTDIGIKTITAGNMILDVSNVQYIYIYTKKDKLIVELDKNKNNVNILSILERINSVDALINTISLLSKFINT